MTMDTVIFMCIFILYLWFVIAVFSRDVKSRFDELESRLDMIEKKNR